MDATGESPGVKCSEMMDVKDNRYLSDGDVNVNMNRNKGKEWGNSKGNMQG